MIKKKITFELSEESINNAIKEIEKIKKDIKNKTEKLKKKIAEFIQNKANLGFKSAISDDILQLSGGPKYANVDVTIEENGDVLVIIANGEDAVWVEFGAGVYHNAPVGSTPNPLGEKFDFRIGGFGQGYGKQDVWYYKTIDGVNYTHGAPASMPMYKALMECVNDLKRIVKGVFNNND